MNNNSIQLTEYQKLYSNDERINKEIFLHLENFILENDTPFLLLKSYRGKKYIQAQNYVGIIQLKNGFTLEILPKITDLEENTEASIKESKKILIKMIKSLRTPPFKNINKANLKNENMPLFEIFIKMFLDEFENLLKFGIKSEYLQKQENLKFLKGKLLIKEQIKKNFIHKERFYTKFDEFTTNRVENKLIKTTLLFLLKKSKNENNKRLIKRYLIFFEQVDISYNIKSDFNKIKLSRDMKHYKIILSWAEIFLLNETFSVYKGKNVAFALLFDMNLLFESYIGQFFKKNCKAYREYEIKLQDKSYFLASGVDENENKKYFPLKPDVVIEITDDNNKIIENVIFDTKWKHLSQNDNISQSDLYQMYAYGTKYENCKVIYLVYPYTEKWSKPTEYKFNKNLTLKILFFDLKINEFIMSNQD